MFTIFIIFDFRLLFRIQLSITRFICNLQFIVPMYQCVGELTEMVLLIMTMLKDQAAYHHDLTKKRLSI